MIDTSDTERRIAERIDPKSTQSLTVSTGAGGLEFANMEQAMTFAKMMAVSSVAVPKFLRGNPGACLAVVIQAIEWRLSPYAVANKSYSVNDRLGFESQLVQAVILQRAPIKGRFKVEFTGEGDKRRCRVSATLRQDDEVVEYISPEVSKIPVKNSPLWKGDPDQQLFYYSGRALCRRHFPDVLLGIYTPDELEAEMHHQGPENARDVTPPPKGIQAKLDALSGVRGHTAVEAEPPHDAETGEIQEQAAEAIEASAHVPSGAQADGGGDDAQVSSPPVQEADDEFPGDKPSPSEKTPLQVAWDTGNAHREKGGARKNPPLELRKPERQAELNAFWAGFDQKPLD